MTDEIRIDIIRYYDRHGRKPKGRGYWVFRIRSPRVTAKDHIYAAQEERQFKSACDRAVEIAAPCRAARIQLLPK